MLGVGLVMRIAFKTLWCLTIEALFSAGVVWAWELGVAVSPRYPGAYLKDLQEFV